MKLQKQDSYVLGITRMISWRLMPSFMESLCFPKEGYLGSFQNFYKRKVKLTEENISFEELMKEIIPAEKRELETFFYLLYQVSGKPEKVYSGEMKGTIGPFFFLDNLYFVEFEKMTICFAIGNNE